MFRQLDRRTALRASGVSLALPLLESMTPVRAAKAQPAPQRAVFLCTTLGLHPPLLWPTATGVNYESTPYLDLLATHRKQFTLFSGLQHEDQTGRQPHDSEMTWLTSARKPGMGGFRNTISVDQQAAAAMGKATRYASLTLGTLRSQSQSYTSGGVMIPAQTSPAKLFAQLFLTGSPAEVAASRQRLKDGASILDALKSQSQQLRRRASAADHHLLADYFDAVRGAEKSIQDAEGWLARPKPKVRQSPPSGIPDSADIIGRTRLLLDLITLVLQTDSSRVVSVMIQDHFAVPKVKGVTGNHHNLSHHGQDAAKIAQLQKIETEVVRCFGELIGNLSERAEAQGTLLDHTSVLFGSNLGNANAHHARNLPIFLAGGGFAHGQYVSLPEATPLCNLFVTVLRRLGVPTDSFGQSTGALSW